jgi:hypothetical protein
MICLGITVPAVSGRAAEATDNLDRAAATADVVSQPTVRHDWTGAVIPNLIEDPKPHPTQSPTPRPIARTASAWPSAGYSRPTPTTTEAGGPPQAHHDWSGGVIQASAEDVTPQPPSASTRPFARPASAWPTGGYYHQATHAYSPSRRNDVRVAQQPDMDLNPPPVVPPSTPMTPTSPMKSATPMTPASPPMTTQTGPIEEATPPMAGGCASGTCGCNSPGYWMCDDELFMPGRWFGGAEYLFVRPHQQTDEAFETSPIGGSGADVQTTNFDAPYRSGLKAFLGWRTDCDRAWRFTYTYIFDDTERSATVPAGSVINSPLGASLAEGDAIIATQHVLLNTWDIENIRKLALPEAFCNSCAGWDLGWSWGVRIIDFDEKVRNDVSGPDAAVFTQESSFVGAGPRFGFEMHRQFGCSAMSGFLGADAGLLLGGLKTSGSDTPAGLSSAEVVPNFDIRIGVCWQPRPEMAITTGWMFETFGDMINLNGTASVAAVPTPQRSSLSYDGLFVRGEFRF